MKAKEMFEKLGYICNKNEDGIIRYTNNYDSDVVFNKKGFYDIMFFNTSKRITTELISAINKQMDEMGWK